MVDHTEPSLRVGVMARLRAYFIAGILITAPIAITFYVAWIFLSFVDERVTPLIPDAYNPQRWGVPGAGLVMIVVALTLIGALTAGWVGRGLVQASDDLLSQMPILRGIYSATKQIIETVLTQKSSAFREVVLIEYPRRGIWTLAFVSGATAGEVGQLVNDELVNVFVPTTPNPTSGFLLFLPRQDVRRLEMSVEDGIKMVVSGGIITPDWRPKPVVAETSSLP
jgi:uncharacterized membrane protein